MQRAKRLWVRKLRQWKRASLISSSLLNPTTVPSTDFLYDLNKANRDYLDEKGYPYEYMETPGGHIWKNWRIYLTHFASEIFK